MKTCLFKTKKLLIVILFSLMNLVVYAQEGGCVNFNDGGVHNWIGINANVTNQSLAPTADGTPYLRTGDMANRSWQINTIDYTGDLTDAENPCQLCWDYKVFDDAWADESKEIHPFIRIYRGNGPEDPNGLHADFNFTNVTITENSDWIQLCAPFILAVDAMPSTAFGKWQMPTGQGLNDFNELITDVDGVAFLIDVAGSPVHFFGESIGVDNICFLCCSPIEKASENMAENNNNNFSCNCEIKATGCCPRDLIQFHFEDKKGNPQYQFCIDQHVFLSGNITPTADDFRLILSYWDPAKHKFGDLGGPITFSAPLNRIDITQTYENLGVKFYKGVIYRIRLVIVIPTCSWVETSEEFKYNPECCSPEEYIDFHFEPSVSQDNSTLCFNKDDVLLVSTIPCSVDEYKLGLSKFVNGAWMYVGATDWIPWSPSENINDLFENQNFSFEPGVRYRIRLILALPTCGWTEINHEFIYEEVCCDGMTAPKNLRVEGNKLVWDELPGALQYRIIFSAPNEFDPIPFECIGCNPIFVPTQYSDKNCWEVPEEYREGCFFWRVVSSCEDPPAWGPLSGYSCFGVSSNGGGKKIASGNDFTEFESAISVFPNPSNGLVNIEFDSKLNGVIEVEILDIHGVLIKSLSLNSSDGHGTKIDLTNSLSSGVWVFKFSSQGTSVIKKVVIN